VHGGVIVRRVSTLRRPPEGNGGRLLAAAAGAVAVCTLISGHAITDFVELFRAWLR
jgi:hypothetical protein